MKRFLSILTAALLFIAAIGCANAYANSTGEKTEFTSETAEEPENAEMPADIETAPIEEASSEE